MTITAKYIFLGIMHFLGIMLDHMMLLVDKILALKYSLHIVYNMIVLYTLGNKLSIALANARVKFRQKLTYILKMFRQTFSNIIICMIQGFFCVKMTKISNTCGRQPPS